MEFNATNSNKITDPQYRGYYIHKTDSNGYRIYTVGDYGVVIQYSSTLFDDILSCQQIIDADICDNGHYITWVDGRRKGLPD